MMDEMKSILVWCLCLNFLVLLIWFGVFILAHQWIYRLHSRWFALSVETFDAIHYSGLAVYKIGILLFNLAPLLALHFAG
jgi:hypothetical protein